MLVTPVGRRSRAAAGGRWRQRGFTLIELMVVVVLLAILSSIAGPSFRSFIGTMNSKSAAFDLIGDLTAARAEAIKRNAAVAITPVGGSWVNGWRVVSGAVTLRQRSAPNSALSISGAPAAGVVFRPNGRIADEIADANLKWLISSSISGVTSRCVVITPTGSARSNPGGCT